MKKRIANVATRENVGFEYVQNQLQLETPFGKEEKKQCSIFFPGEEEELIEEYNRMEEISKIMKEEKKNFDKILLDVFHGMKDLRLTIKRCEKHTLSVVELFELKTLLLQMERLCIIEEEMKVSLPKKFSLERITPLLDQLDPRKERLNTFYIYEDFSSKLANLREEKRHGEVQFRKSSKKRKEAIKETYGIHLTPKFDYIVSKADTKQMEIVDSINELEIADQDYMSMTFRLVTDEEGYDLQKKIEEIQEEIDKEEEKVREKLSRKVSEYEQVLIENTVKIGQLDFIIAKVAYGDQHHCIRPKILTEHKMMIQGGRQLQVEDVLKAKGKEYMPVDVTLEQGVTCISGANMGGKTVSLKLVGLVQLLTQYGFFIPCSYGEVGLSASVALLMGDSQSVERGLSSFGSEMEELKEILDHCKEKSMILIDEIASGTNPVEGPALTRSLIDYLSNKPYITLMTTHFDGVWGENPVRLLQVIGLAHVNFDLLNGEIRYANRKERIGIIGKYMDYGLREVSRKEEIPRDALNIAKMLGIGNEIIDNARKYLNE